MKKNIKTIYIIELLFIIQTLIILNKTNKEIISIVFLSIILFIASKKLYIKKDNNILKKEAIRTITIIFLLILIITYTLGIILGFNKGFNLLSKKILLLGFIPTIMITILIEKIRYIIIYNSHKNKKTIIIFTILLIIYNLIIKTNNSFENSEKIFIYICSIGIPTILEEILSTYIIYNIGLLPSIYYKLGIRTYMYIFPIIPALGDYIHSIIFILMPYLIYIKLNENKLIFNRDKKKIRKININIFIIPTFTLMTILIILISGIFNYKLIAIASNSMSPVFKRGDAIIYKKINPEKLEIGDVVALEYEGIIVTHRIVNIKYQDNKRYFETKGDNNKVKDGFTTPDKKVLGKVNHIIKYIGYPTIFINETMKKGE